MKLPLLLLAIIVTTIGVIVCDEGMVKTVFMVGFFCSLGISCALMLIGQFE